MGRVIKGPWRAGPHLSKTRTRIADLEHEVERQATDIHHLRQAAAVLLIEASHQMISDETLRYVDAILSGNRISRQMLETVSLYREPDVAIRRWEMRVASAPLLLRAAVGAYNWMIDVAADLDDNEEIKALREAIDLAIPNTDDADSMTPPGWTSSPPPMRDHVATVFYPREEEDEE